jgi:protein required for attachment to host cells
MLGDLRAELGDPLQRLVVAEVDKNLAMLPPQELAPHLATVTVQ